MDFACLEKCFRYTAPMPDPRPRGRPRTRPQPSAPAIIQALDRGLAILRIVAEGGGLTLSQIATASGQAPATAYRALLTLRQHGLADCAARDQRWHLGPGAWRIGAAFLRRDALLPLAEPRLRALQRDSGETAVLAIRQDAGALVLAQVEGPAVLRAVCPPGSVLPLHASAPGLALLAWAPGPVLADTLAALPADDPQPDPGALVLELAAIRARGHATWGDPAAAETLGIGAPVLDAGARPVAALALLGPAARLPPARAAVLGAGVRAAADAVTRALGGTPPAPGRPAGG